MGAKRSKLWIVGTGKCGSTQIYHMLRNLGADFGPDYRSDDQGVQTINREIICRMYQKFSLAKWPVWTILHIRDTKDKLPSDLKEHMISAADRMAPFVKGSLFSLSLPFWFQLRETLPEQIWWVRADSVHVAEQYHQMIPLFSLEQTHAAIQQRHDLLGGLGLRILDFPDAVLTPTERQTDTRPSLLHMIKSVLPERSEEEILEEISKHEIRDRPIRAER